MSVTHCACGRPLHYTDATIQRIVTAYTETLGERVIVTHESGRQYVVQRHYIALHGLRAVDLEDLADAGIVDRVDAEAKR